MRAGCQRIAQGEAAIAIETATPGDVQRLTDVTAGNAIADWLDRNRLVEPIVTARGPDPPPACGRRATASSSPPRAGA
jgi:hypothetical protein